MNVMDYLSDNQSEDEEPQDPIFDFDISPYGWGELNMGFPKVASEES